ncbi:hypothetical protein JW992_12380 [candidate division KSB1 bacterium]|nr:hypothetical protein [candidate division KSB1 bacterium]
MTVSTRYDLALAFDWEYDRDFIELLASEAENLGLRSFTIDPDSLETFFYRLKGGEFFAKVLVDRASDTDPRFFDLQRELQSRGCRIIDPLAALHWASDKATMHLEFIQKGLNTPYTHILPPFSQKPHCQLDETQLTPLGEPFVIKPANTTGGGQGVILSAVSLDDVNRARSQYPNDKYLIQERVRAKTNEGRLFWFRVFYAAGLTLFCWWNPETHLYRQILSSESNRDEFSSLIRNMEQIARICGLTFFSSEMAITENDRLVVVDYVNEICDMRLQSHHRDGVPDLVVEAICKRLAHHCLDLCETCDGGHPL